MPNVTVLGAGNTVVTIPVNTTAQQTAAQAALNGVTAAILANTVTAFTANGTLPSASGPIELVYLAGGPTAVTLPATSNVVSQVTNLTTSLSISTSAITAATVVSGSGGLNYTQTAPTVTGSFIAVGGGTSSVQLAAGKNTVSVDVGTGAASTGSAIVNALTGGATVSINATPNNALVAMGLGDSLSDSGASTFVYVADTSEKVTLQGGSAGFFIGSAINIAAAAGNETIGVVNAFIGSVPALSTTESITGAASGGGSITEDILSGSATVSGLGTVSLSTGSLIINPLSENVLVYGPSGAATTLFGASQGNLGSDSVFFGTGQFAAGSGGKSLLIGAASATLTGGSATDTLSGTAAGDSLNGGLGAANIFAVAGDTISTGASSGIVSALQGGDTIIAGSGSATVFGHAVQGVTGTGDVYSDGGVASQLTIGDFNSSDTFKLSAGETASVATYGSGTLVTLSDGSKIVFLNGFVNSSNLGTYVHS